MTQYKQAGGYHMPIVDKSARPGAWIRILVLAMVLTLSALAFVVFKDHLENEIVLGILGVLAMVGIFFLVSAIIGFIEIMPQSRQSELAHAFLDGHPDAR